MLHNKGLLARNDAKTANPFATIGMIKFWVISTIFYMTFPLSLLISYLILGPHKTKRLIRALVNDFLQTIFVLLVVLVLIVWAIWHFMVPLSGM